MFGSLFSQLHEEAPAQSGKKQPQKRKRKDSVQALPNQHESGKQKRKHTANTQRHETLPPPFDGYTGSKRFLVPTDPQFNALMQRTYEGFVHEPPTWAADEAHARYLDAQRVMEARQLFQYDVTQPMGLGTNCSKTFVTRTLVGEPGITYKYLGLREFAHPWNPNEAKKDEDTSIMRALSCIRDLNSTLTRRASTLLLKHAKRKQQQLKGKTQMKIKGTTTEQTGSCKFNLVLINRMVVETIADTKTATKSTDERASAALPLKEEPFYGMGRCSVSW